MFIPDTRNMRPCVISKALMYFDTTLVDSVSYLLCFWHRSFVFVRLEWGVPFRKTYGPGSVQDRKHFDNCVGSLQTVVQHTHWEGVFSSRAGQSKWEPRGETVRVCMCLFMYVCVCSCVCVWMYVRVCVCTCMYVRVWFVCVCMCVCVLSNLCECVCVR